MDHVVSVHAEVDPVREHLLHLDDQLHAYIIGGRQPQELDARFHDWIGCLRQNRRTL